MIPYCGAQSEGKVELVCACGAPKGSFMKHAQLHVPLCNHNHNRLDGEGLRCGWAPPAGTCRAIISQVEVPGLCVRARAACDFKGRLGCSAVAASGWLLPLVLLVLPHSYPATAAVAGRYILDVVLPRRGRTQDPIQPVGSGKQGQGQGHGGPSPFWL